MVRRDKGRNLEFRILGPLEALEDGAPVALGGAKQKALLAVLLLNANEVVSTERLIDALWDEPPARPTKAVQVYVARLRKALGRTLQSRPPGYVLELTPEQLDLARFQRLCGEASDRPGATAAKLREALSLWRGPALAEFTNEPFARAERSRLEELRLEALEERIELELSEGAHAALTGELEALVGAHPLRERPRAQLMLALYRCGRHADALALYREGRQTLVQELGIEPSRALRALEAAILRQDEALDLPRRSDGSSVAGRRPADAHRPPDKAKPIETRDERRVVSVICVEANPSSAGLGTADPEDRRAALQPFRDVTQSEIERFGGSVISLVGNTVIGLFGAPAHEDDPERAVRAALALRHRITEETADLQVRMAISTGPALIPGGPSSSERDAMATGDVVGATQTLVLHAPANSIVVGDQTYRTTRDTIEYRPAASRDGQSTWEAIEARAKRGVDLVREPRTAMVGRAHELDMLHAALARAVEERTPQLVTLVGVPGIGKSRLVFELAKARASEPEAIRWLQGRCLSYGDGVSFWALGEIVKTEAGILESDTAERADEKLRAAVTAVVSDEEEAGWVESHLRPLVGARGDSGSGESFAAWSRFLDSLAQRTPLVLAIEDLQWADDGLLDFIEELAGRLRDCPLLVLCTARLELLERRPGWGGGQSNGLTISLPPLSNADTAALVSALEHAPRETDALASLVARAGGNPLCAEQLARVSAEVEPSKELPDTVHGIIAARLDTLSAVEKAVLQDGAIVGEVFWPGALEAIGHLSREEAEQLLVGLERKEFVQKARSTSIAGEAEYAFRHVLLRDVAYDQIARAAREHKHRSAAEWTEALGRAEDHAEMLAHHFLSALRYARSSGHEDRDLVDRTRRSLAAAGQRAFGLASYASAARFYNDALELAQDADSGRVALIIQAGRARHAADGSGIDLLEQGFQALESRGDGGAAAEVAVEIARRSWLGGDRDRAYNYIERALRLIDECGDSRGRAYALVERAGYHMNASEHHEAIELAQEALPLTRELRLDELRIRALDVIGCSRASLGDPNGIDDLRSAIALARAHGAFSRLIVAELNLHSALLARGQITAAFHALDAACRDAASYGTADQRSWCGVSQAHAAALGGRWEEASQLLDEGIAQAEAGAFHYSDPAARGLRARIALARGDLTLADTDSESALARARQTKDPQLLAPALVVRAIVLLAQDRREHAHRLATELIDDGSRLVPALLELHPTVTPIELAWLMRQLGRETELSTALEDAWPTPWVEAATAITSSDYERALAAVASLGVPPVEAYTQLRVAEELVKVGGLLAARDLLARAAAFYRGVGAAGYVAQADKLSAEADTASVS
jgi:DNA-binding SARP family transcriptional activator